MNWEGVTNMHHYISEEGLPSSLRTVASRIDFHIDNVEEVNRRYLEWCRTGDEELREDIVVWLYCYVRRYYLQKFLTHTTYNSADMEEVVTRVFRRIYDSLEDVRSPERFANWVSVICKRSFINFLRSRKYYYHSRTTELADYLDLRGHNEHLDPMRFLAVLSEAIKRLPEYLRETAELRFIIGCEYKEIEQMTGRPATTHRVYASKAMILLKDDPELLRFIEDRDESGR